MRAEELGYSSVWVGDHLFLPDYAIEYSPANWYEALACSFPYRSVDSTMQLVEKFTNAPLPLGDHVELAGDAEAAVMRALSTEPKMRFDSCGDFAGAFASGVGGSPTSKPRH